MTLSKVMSTDIMASLLMMNSTGSHTLHMSAVQCPKKKKLFLLSQLRHFVDTSKRKLFYHAHISSHLTYASTVWDGCSDILFRNLILFIGELQSWCCPIHPQEQKLRYSIWVYSRSDRNLVQHAVLVFKACRNLAPQYLTSLFVCSNSRSSRTI